MKGIMSSIIVLFAFLSTLLVVMVFSSSIQESRDLVNLNAVGDRVFYNFASLEQSVKRIMENDMNSTFNYRIVESSGRNVVVINQSFPSSKGNFSRDILNFERFAERTLNQSNLVLDLNFSSVLNCFPLTILPYNISYMTYNNTLTTCGFGEGQRYVRVTPNGTGSNYISGYDMLIVANATRINSTSAFWAASGCSGGTLNWTVRVVGNMSTSYGPVTMMVDPAGGCQFAISESFTRKAVFHLNNTPLSSDPGKTLLFGSRPGFNVTFVLSMNLTDVPGKLAVSLPPQSLKVRETLFKIERNDTVTLQ